MIRKKVFWKKGAPKFKCKPSQFFQIQVEHDKLYGGLNMDLLLDESRQKGHPLHADVWADGDDAAAAKYRLSIISKMARSLVVIHRHEDREIETRAIVSSIRPDSGERRFQSVRVVMSEPESRAAVIKEALRRFQALKREYQHLKELADIFDAIDSLSAVA